MQNNMQFDQFSKQATEFGQSQFEAFVQASTVFAKGMEDIVRTSVAIAQDTAEKQAAYAKDAMQSKTLNELAETQNKIAQENFNDFISSATKISEMSAKMLNEGIAPLTRQMETAMQKPEATKKQKAA